MIFYDHYDDYYYHYQAPLQYCYSILIVIQLSPRSSPKKKSPEQLTFLKLTSNPSKHPDCWDSSSTNKRGFRRQKSCRISAYVLLFFKSSGFVLVVNDVGKTTKSLWLLAPINHQEHMAHVVILENNRSKQLTSKHPYKNNG